VEAARRLGIHGVSNAQLKAIAAMTMSKPVSATTAAITLLKIDTITKSSSVTRISSVPPGLRMKFVSNSKQIYIPPVDKYCARPNCLSHVTFVDYFKGYRLESAPMKSKQLIGQDQLGNYVYTSDHLVRFTDYHPAHHTEAYFYNVLLATIPFSHEAELLSDSSTNPSRSYFSECQLRGIIQSVDDIEEHVASYAARHLWKEEQRQQLVDLILQNQPIDQLEVPGSPNAVPLQTESVNPADIEKDTLEMLGLLDEFSDMASATLTAEQQVAFESLRDAKGLHVLSETFGAGKNFVTQYMIHHWCKSGKKVLLCATTGLAAVNLSSVARTLHNAFHIPHDGRPLSILSPSDPSYQALCQANVIVIDEMSMLTCMILSLVIYRLSQLLGSTSAVLQSKLILLSGDHARLPPVCHCRGVKASSEDRDSICFQCHIWWPTMTFHHLNSSFRHHKVASYLQFLNTIRLRRPTQAEIDKVLGDCLITEAEAIRLADEHTTILCIHNQDVNRLNNAILHRLFPPSQIVPVPLKTNAPFEPFTKDWLANQDFYTLSEVAVKASVIIIENLNIKAGASNGGKALMESIVKDADGHVRKIFVRLYKMNKTLEIFSRAKCGHLYHDGKQYTKFAFPLRLAYAMTGHKSQGATIAKHAIIHVKEGFCPGLLYVMFSRVTEKRLIRLLTPLNPEHFRPV
jgi:hypothetical protein